VNAFKMKSITPHDTVFPHTQRDHFPIIVATSIIIVIMVSYDNSTTVGIIVRVTCVLSALGSLYMIISFFFLFPSDFKKLQSRKQVLFLSLCDLLVSLSYLMYSLPTQEGPIETDCKIQSFMNIFSNEAAFFWTGFIALFVFISRRWDVDVATKYTRYFHVFGWGIPLISASAVAYFDTWGADYASKRNWCWISSDAAWYWFLIGGKGVEWLTCSFITVLYIFVFVDVRRNSSTASQLLIAPRFWKNNEKKLLVIPIIFVVARAPGSVVTIMEWRNVHPAEWLAILLGVGDTIQGFANFLLFAKFNICAEKIQSLCSHKSSKHHSSLLYGSDQSDTVSLFSDTPNAPTYSANRKSYLKI